MKRKGTSKQASVVRVGRGRLLALALAWVQAPYGFSQSSGAGESRLVLEEVLVTAQKRTQSLQDVPMSVTAIGAETLAQLGAEDILDYFATVPGLSFQSLGPAGDQHGDRFLSIRGISADTGAATVGFYINETPIKFVDPNLFDVNRVEVLRGPQGTLYGASSMGGTIKVITNEPEFDAFGAELDGSVSTISHGSESVSVNAMFNIPLVPDRLALRVVGFNRDEGGYIDNILRPTDSTESPVVPSPVDLGVSNVDEDFNSQTVRGGRAALKFQATDRLTFTPSILHQDFTVDGDPRYKKILDSAAPEFSVGSVAPIVNEFTDDDLVTHQPTNSEISEKYTIYDLTTVYDMDRVSFVSSISYYDREKSGITDMAIIFPFFFGPTAPVDNSLEDFETEDAVTAEFRISSTGDNRFDWLIGGFYQDVETQFIQSLLDTDFNDIAFGGIPVVPGGLFLAFNREDQLEQLAVFGEMRYHISDRLNITAGLRWSDFDLSTAAQGDGLFNGGPTSQTGEASDDAVSPRFQVAYDVSDDLMTYINIAKGVRPGFGLFPVGETCNDELDALGLSRDRTQVGPDSLWSYEAGFKGQFMDNRMTLNGAAYYMDWDDIQQNLSLVCGFSTSVNGGKARSTGFELEMSLAATENWVFQGGLSYVDAELTEDAPNLGAEDGDRILRTADWNFSFAGIYSFRLNDDLDGYARIDYQYTGDSKNGFDFSTPLLELVNDRPSYDVVNARITLLHDGWDFALFAKNLFDERPRIGTMQFITSDVNIYTIQPRTIGLNVRKSL